MQDMRQEMAALNRRLKPPSLSNTHSEFKPQSLDTGLGNGEQTPTKIPLSPDPTVTTTITEIVTSSTTPTTITASVGPTATATMNTTEPTPITTPTPNGNCTKYDYKDCGPTCIRCGCCIEPAGFEGPGEYGCEPCNDPPCETPWLP